MGLLPAEANGYIILFAVSTLLRAIVIAFAPHVNFRGRLPRLGQLNRFFDMLPSTSNLIRPFIWKKKKFLPKYDE
jgi:hypothetical protein